VHACYAKSRLSNNLQNIPHRFEKLFKLLVEITQEKEYAGFDFTEEENTL